ncbi:hypothetical protein HNY73_007715 [Argiope bruennichi]|uniref:Uncharacterized protein n=1 Tax=Argiope bruennichi TaxID=94029 RepID=A0A8T0FHE6_ARGBR|nr:hypothetical protein HNY73_007715 [Argiope bruennichi]
MKVNDDSDDDPYFRLFTKVRPHPMSYFLCIVAVSSPTIADSNFHRNLIVSWDTEDMVSKLYPQMFTVCLELISQAQGERRKSRKRISVTSEVKSKLQNAVRDSPQSSPKSFLGIETSARGREEVGPPCWESAVGGVWLKMWATR